MADEELEMRPIVDGILLSVERIRKLAAGVVLRSDPQPMVVPRPDMEDALVLAEGVAELIKSWAQRVEPLRQMGWGGLVAQILYGAAADGAEGLRRTIANRLERPPSREIEPIHIAVLITYDSRITANRDMLRVLSLELAWNGSPLSAISKHFNDDINAFTAHVVDVIISLLPAIGPFYDIATGILGRRLPDAERLTNTERVLRIAFVGVGAVLSIVVKGGRITARTLMIMQAGKEAQVLRSSLSRVETFRALAVATAKMSAKNAARILEIVDIVRKGGLPSPEQMQLFYSFFHAVNQAATAAHWAALAKKPAHIGGRIGRAKVLNWVAHEPGEKEAIEALAKNLPESEILALPGLPPKDFVNITKGGTKLDAAGRPVFSRAQHVKAPDLALEGALADIYVPKGSNFKTMFNEIAGKSSQGSTVVINMDLTTVAPEALTGSLAKLWGNPAGLSLRRVIVLDSKGFFKVINRPFNFRLADIEWLPAQTLANLRELWDDLEKEDAAALSH
jgi:hypothetical protein